MKRLVMVRALLCASAAMALVSAAYAQGQAVPQSVDPAGAMVQPIQTAEPAAAANPEEIVVTGTRIRTPNLESANPIMSMTNENLVNTGKTSIQEAVSQIGALAGSEGEGEVSYGENRLVLRNLGDNRTLVLIDGQRMVSGFSGSAAVDTNVIPMAMIQRVDVLTGGASAIYGADAVTGVVNFILKDDFEGIAAAARYGNATRGGFRDIEASLTAGHNFDDGQGNLTASYTFGDRPLTLALARREASTDLFEQINNVNGTVPQYVLTNNTVEAFFTDGGARFDPFNADGGFNGDGTPFRHGTKVGGFAGTAEVGGDGLPHWKMFAQGIRPATRRHLLTIKTHYDVSAAVTPYASLIYAKIDSRMVDQESLTVGSQAKYDNPFVPAAVKAALGGKPIFFNRWDLESGYNDVRLNKEMVRTILGLKGTITSNLRYDASLNFGRSTRIQTIENNRMMDRYLAASDVAINPTTGRPDCRSNFDPASFYSLPGDFLNTTYKTSGGAITFTPGPGSGCVPFNPFTKDSSVNQAAIDWIWIPTAAKMTNKEIVANAFLAGDTGDFLTLDGGPLSFVVGGEYRKESSSTSYDTYSGSPTSVAFNNGRDLSGSFDVKEAFGELSVPLFKNPDNPIFRGLTLSGAYRLSDYSTIGKTHTWKAGGTFETFLGLTLRGTLSRAVRAPNIGELFEARQPSSSSLGQRDPCAVANLNLGTDYRRQNCATALTALNPAIDPNKFSPLLGTYYFPIILGGNPKLREEAADTLTAGFLWQPNFVPGLTLSADYFDIRLKNAVLRPTLQSVFNACYDSATLDNPFCALIGRDKVSGEANFADISSVNVAKIRTSGVDFSGSYLLRTDDLGRFRFGIDGTWLQRLDIQKSLLPILTDDKGLFNTDTGGSSPEWALNVDLGWKMGRWDANYLFNYASRTLRSPPLLNAQRDKAAEIISDPYVKAYVNHGIQIGYEPRDDMRLYAGIRNLTDQYPDKTRGSLNGPSGRQGYAGRTFYLGVNIGLKDFWQ